MHLLNAQGLFFAQNHVVPHILGYHGFPNILHIYLPVAMPRLLSIASLYRLLACPSYCSLSCFSDAWITTSGFFFLFYLCLFYSVGKSSVHRSIFLYDNLAQKELEMLANKKKVLVDEDSIFFLCRV
jgi:hypothetical protein